MTKLSPAQVKLLTTSANNNGIIKVTDIQLNGNARNLILNALINKKMVIKTFDGNYRMTNRAYQAIGIKNTKQNLIIELMLRPEGATINQMMQATGWLAHSVRGLISAQLRTALGLNVKPFKNNGVNVYHILAA